MWYGDIVEAWVPDEADLISIEIEDWIILHVWEHDHIVEATDQQS